MPQGEQSICELISTWLSATASDDDAQLVGLMDKDDGVTCDLGPEDVVFDELEKMTSIMKRDLEQAGIACKDDRSH